MSTYQWMLLEHQKKNTRSRNTEKFGTIFAQMMLQFSPTKAILTSESMQNCRSHQFGQIYPFTAIRIWCNWHIAKYHIPTPTVA
jgi:hypothetical protein